MLLNNYAIKTYVIQSKGQYEDGAATALTKYCHSDGLFAAPTYIPLVVWFTVNTII